MVILSFSFFILFIVIVLLRKIRLAIDVICRLGKLIQTISLFYYNIKACEQQIEDIEKVINEISEISKENYEIFDNFGN